MVLSSESLNNILEKKVPSLTNILEIYQDAQLFTPNSIEQSYLQLHKNYESKTREMMLPFQKKLFSILLTCVEILALTVLTRQNPKRQSFL